MNKVFVIMSCWSDSNTHESGSCPVLVCSSMEKASEMVKKFDLTAVGCLYEIQEVRYI